MLILNITIPFEIMTTFLHDIIYSKIAFKMKIF